MGAPIEKHITLEELEAGYREVLEEIADKGVVYRVTAKVAGGTCFYPSGMTTGPDAVVFVLGPGAICGKVLGLEDAEYGWKVTVRLGDVRSVWDLAPGYRRHPFIPMDNGIVVSIMESEYEEIVARQAR